MDLIVVMGPQAVGKMTVGKVLEEQMDARLLFNHETLDIFARFLGYTKKAFELSDQVRFNLFEAFVKQPNTAVKGIIFTVVVAFDNQADMEYLQKITNIFKDAGGRTFLIELYADVETRLVRNTGESRLLAKPSKRNLEFSRKELLSSVEKYRLNSLPGEVEDKIQGAYYHKIENTSLSPYETAEQILAFIEKVNQTAFFIE